MSAKIQKLHHPWKWGIADLQKSVSQLDEFRLGILVQTARHLVKEMPPKQNARIIQLSGYVSKNEEEA